MSESKIVNKVLNEFFKVKMLKEDVDTITETMAKAIEKRLGKRFDRLRFPLMILFRILQNIYS